MGATVKTRIIKIGNSQGIRIPKLLIEQVGLGEEVELEARQDSLVVRSVRSTRHGWAEQFRLMAERRDDQLLDEVATTTWDDEDWQW